VRTVFLGTSAFAVAVLERLAGGEHRPALVVTRPDRPRGRGRRVEAPPVAEAARRLGLELFQPADVNAPEAVERIAAAAPEAACVCAFGALVREPLLSAHPMLNVHPSLLPRWRGAAPIERAIMAGDEQTGVSIMQVTEGLDSGPVCLQRVEPVAGDDTYGSLSRRLAAMGGELLIQALDERPPCRPQADAGATYAEKIEAHDRRLDPGRSAIELERVVRALHPHIRARLELADGTALGVHAACARDARAERGEIVVQEGRLLLGCAAGALELHEVQPPGGRAMDAAAYLRGHGDPGWPAG